MPPTQGHILFLPEILNLVCELSQPPEWLALLTTSRPIFSIVASHIWERLDGEGNLTDLLELKGGPEQANWGRFDIYAPFVKHMTVYGRTSGYFRGRLREAALSRAQREPLLPKLVSITILSQDLQDDTDSFIYLELFLSASVSRVEIVPVSPNSSARLSYPATKLLLARLASSAPNLKQVVFHPADIALHPLDDENLVPLHVLIGPYVQDSIASLVHLREITSSIMLIDGSGLVALGTLPQLERLAMDGSDHEQPRELKLYAPEDSFPALVELSMLQIDTTTMLALMSIKPFVQKLTSLSLGQTFPLLDSSIRDHEYEWLQQQMPLVLKHTPSLKRFSYDAGSYSPYVTRGAYNLRQTPLLEYMAPLPLEYVSLSGLSFSDEIFLHCMASAWPKVKELRIPEQRVPWDAIEWYSRIPRLERLAIMFFFRSLPSTWITSNSSLKFVEDTIDGRDLFGSIVVGADQAASFLVALWPNLREITWPYLDGFLIDKSAPFAMQEAQSLEKISQISQLVKATYASKRRRY